MMMVETLCCWRAGKDVGRCVFVRWIARMDGWVARLKCVACMGLEMWRGGGDLVCLCFVFLRDGGRWSC